MRQVTRVRRDAFGKNGFGPLSLPEFLVGAYATTSSLGLVPAFRLAASRLSLFFRPNRKWLVELRSRRGPDLFLKLLDAFVRRV
jgi:hypothetical protein